MSPRLNREDGAQVSHSLQLKLHNFWISLWVFRFIWTLNTKHNSEMMKLCELQSVVGYIPPKLILLRTAESTQLILANFVEVLWFLLVGSQNQLQGTTCVIKCTTEPKPHCYQSSYTTRVTQSLLKIYALHSTMLGHPQAAVGMGDESIKLGNIGK